MRIALFSDTFVPEVNGVATSVYTLFKVLQNEGHQVYVVTTNPFDSKIQYDQHILRVPGIELKRIYGYRLASFYYPQIVSIVKAMKLDLIHVHTEYGIGIFGKIMARQLHLPVVYTYHTMLEDYTHYINKGHFEYFSKSVINSVSRFFGDTCTELISPSSKTKDALRRYGVGTHINIVPTGVNLDKFDRTHIDVNTVNQIREQLGLKGFEVILSLGRVAPEKSIDVLIRGYAHLLKETDRPLKLVIVGGGPALVALKQLSEELQIQDKVVFTGKVAQEETQNYYQLGTVFASASLTETQGLTFLEAMASGLPVLWRYDKNLDEMLVDGQTGLIFKDELDFAHKVLQLLSFNDQQKKTMKDALARRASDFSSAVFYQKIMEVYQRAIRKKW